MEPLRAGRRAGNKDETMTVGFRVSEHQPPADLALIERAAKLPVANIGDAMNRMQSMRGGFRSFGGRRAVVGPARTVRARPGDNLMLHRAIDLARPGEVVVCDGGGDLAIALAGDLMISHAAKEAETMAAIAGAGCDRAWVERTLSAKGCAAAR